MILSKNDQDRLLTIFTVINLDVELSAATSITNLKGRVIER